MADSRKRILIVEDDEALRGLVARVFSDNGYDVEQAGDGAEGIERFHARPADLVILDLMMPGIDGWGVLGNLNKRTPPPSVVMLTVQTEYELFDRATREGVAAYVEKPFSILALLDTCSELLKNGRRTLSPRERRDSPRRLLRVPARVLYDESTWCTDGKLIDLSLGGARVAVDTPLPFHDGLRVAFDLPGISTPLSLEGRVQWRVPVARGFYYGVAFVKLAPEAERQISRVVSPA